MSVTQYTERGVRRCWKRREPSRPIRQTPLVRTATGAAADAVREKVELILSLDPGYAEEIGRVIGYKLAKIEREGGAR